MNWVDGLPGIEPATVCLPVRDRNHLTKLLFDDKKKKKVLNNKTEKMVKFVRNVDFCAHKSMIDFLAFHTANPFAGRANQRFFLLFWMSSTFIRLWRILIIDLISTCNMPQKLINQFEMNRINSIKIIEFFSFFSSRNRNKMIINQNWIERKKETNKIRKNTENEKQNGRRGVRGEGEFNNGWIYSDGGVLRPEKTCN